MAATPASMHASAARRKIGLALGGGAALGLAHIGVLRVLEERGVVPDVVAGTSIGAVVGAAYVFGQLDAVEAAFARVSWRDIVRLVDVRFGKCGLLGGETVIAEVRKYIGDATFAEADRPFAVVAADLVRDAEVTLTAGRVADAVRASVSLPGIFMPVVRDGMLLIDGGMKNPVPVTTCRSLGADLVIAVDVTGDHAGQAAAAGIAAGAPFRGGIMEVVFAAISMVTRELARAQCADHPPDALVVPEIGHVRQYAFGRGTELMAAGRRAAEAAWPEIDRVFRARGEHA